MSAESDAVDNLTAKVTAIETVAGSIETLVAGLAAQLRANANVPAAINALADKLDADTTVMAKAVTDNTI